MFSSAVVTPGGRNRGGDSPISTRSLPNHLQARVTSAHVNVCFFKNSCSCFVDSALHWDASSLDGPATCSTSEGSTSNPKSNLGARSGIPFCFGVSCRLKSLFALSSARIFGRDEDREFKKKKRDTGLDRAGSVDELTNGI